MDPPIDPFEIALRYAIDLVKAKEMTPHEVTSRTAWARTLVAELERSTQRRTDATEGDAENEARLMESPSRD